LKLASYLRFGQTCLPLEDIQSVQAFSPHALQRAGPIAQMGELLREFGVASSKASRGTGVNLSTLTPDSVIPFSAVISLLERAVELTGCPHFGLLLGSRYGFASHGLISRLAAQTSTLRQALLAFVSLQPGYSSGAAVYLLRMGQDFAFGYGIYERTSRGSAQLYDCVLAFGCTFVRALTKDEVTPVEILFSHRAPDDLAPYQRILAAPLRFNQNQSCLVLSSGAIDCPLQPLPEKIRDRITREKSIATLGLRDVSTASSLRHIMRPQLLAGDASMEGAARALGQIPRTLRRHLAAEGRTFEGIRDDVRFVLARELLALTDLRVGDISASLVFANPPAFVRAFRRWSGRTPTQWRASPTTGS
jgi:AraC-like DNA-binding protein